MSQVLVGLSFTCFCFYYSTVRVLLLTQAHHFGRLKAASVCQHSEIRRYWRLQTDKKTSICSRYVFDSRWFLHIRRSKYGYGIVTLKKTCAFPSQVYREKCL